MNRRSVQTDSQNSYWRYWQAVVARLRKKESKVFYKFFFGFGVDGEVVVLEVMKHHERYERDILKQDERDNV
jgi:hypothetical protein